MAVIADAVQQIQAEGLPVLFTDTCSLVDVIRAPIRPKKLKGCVLAGWELRQFVTSNPARCIIVAPSFVRGEWQDHAGRTKVELQKHFADLNEYAAEFHDACAHVGITPTFGKPSYDSAGLADRLFDLSQQLLDAAVHLDAHDDTNKRAFNRAIHCTPPSRKGGEVKDCTIIEECLEVSRQLRGTGFAPKLVFCTSNTDDYCECGHLHPALAVDFAAAGLTFTMNLPWAVHELKP